MEIINSASVECPPFFIERLGIGQYVLKIKDSKGQSHKITYPAISPMHIYSIRKGDLVDLSIVGKECVRMTKSKPRQKSIRPDNKKSKGLTAA